MSSDDFERILAQEAQLMYQRASGFSPVKGDLTVWRGEIEGRGEYRGLKFEVEIKIPPTFPQDPPSVRMLSPTDHPNVDPETGRVRLSILDQWRPEYHVYHVVNTIKGTFARVPPRPLFKPHIKKVMVSAIAPGEPSQVASPETVEKLSALESQIKELQRKLQEKDEEIAYLKGRLTTQITPEVKADRVSAIKVDVDEQLELESEKIAIEDLLRSLEEKFESGEIDPTDYTRLYRKYKKEWYIVTKKLRMLKSLPNPSSGGER
ncbi:MAG: ubiquitin-conjugating enzyme E2 [Candidatus Jordarchaeales archaeon]